MVSGLGFAEFVEANLFVPFNLQSTFVQCKQIDSTRLAIGYWVDGYGLPHVHASDDFKLDTLGDGSIYSSLSDLIRWQSLFWNGEIISDQTLKQMKTPGTLDSGESFEYGIGLQVEKREAGRTWCGHGGSWTTTTTLIGRYMAEQTSVIVLSNELMAPVHRISQISLAMRCH